MLARKNHPRVGAAITLPQFLSEAHVVVNREARSYEIVERFLKKKGYQRRITLVTPHCLSVPFIIADSDLITILPISLIEAFARFSDLKTVALPFSAPVYTVHQYWHERFSNDVENLWLRRKIAEMFKTINPPPRTGKPA